ncbi:MAG: hypothetical protein QOE93_1256 [Actinomycetota bacterium]|jgi:phage tail-like protein|nr:hypothetical protein [Actinomycetota bacterium]
MPNLQILRGFPSSDWQISGLHFQVEIDGRPLGNWARVEGLSVKFELAEYRTGEGRNHRVLQPAQATYSNVRLSRTSTLVGTLAIMRWLRTTAFDHAGTTTAKITGIPLCLTDSDTHVVAWELDGVLPVAWSGPQFDATSGKPAIETLEIAHEGFHFLNVDTPVEMFT